MDLNSVEEREVVEADEVFKRHRGLYVLRRYVRIILWVAVVLFVMTIISIIRSFHLEGSVETLDKHTANLEQETNAAKQAAIEARDTLQAALEELETRRVTNVGSSPEAISEALIAVNRIEQHLCGGPCE